MSEVAGGSFVQFSVLSLDHAWEGVETSAAVSGIEDYTSHLNSAGVVTHIYLLSGLKASADLLLWKVAGSVEALQEHHLALKRTLFGRHLREVAAYTGVTKPSTYTKTENEYEFLTATGKRRRYLSFYPFTKTTEWYLLDFEKRRKIMGDHIAIGRKFPEVSQTLLYSFGADDQEFVVAYEMDDLKYYIDCVMALRESESRLYTRVDTPVYTGVRKSPSDLALLFGGTNE